MIPLPIDSYVDAIVDAVRQSRAAVVTAAPGAGKTTRLPPALVADGPVILLQPRRVAARAIASRIAEERGWTVGKEVGWQVRFERNASRETKLLVVTEGILTARLQTDPLLSDFRTIILDEFHERSIHADLAIALARQAWRARDSSTGSGSPRAASRGDDLRIVVMSATIDSAAVSSFLDDCPVVDVPGRVHPIDISYAPGEPVAEAVRQVLHVTSGNVLCFLPGANEIRRAITELQNIASPIGSPEVLPLYGALSSDDQDAVLRPSSRRRVIVATNIAETSLTVPGVTGVVDTGFQKVARYDADRGVDSLETERITADAADQRAGRAGRVAPGVVRRLWDSRDRLRPHREADIGRVDLAGTVLDVIAWGGDPKRFEWFERPTDDALDAALTLLDRLGLTAGGRLTPVGEEARRLPLHPRLARMMTASAGARNIVRACALLSERHLLPPHAATTTSDVLSALDRWSAMPPHVHRAAEQIGRLGPSHADLPDAEFRRALLSGYPDRVGRRREPGSASVLLASGAGATLARESGVRDGEFLIALDVQSSVRAQPDSLIRMASEIERDWLAPTSSELVHRFDAASGRVKAARVERYDALTLGEHPVAIDPALAAPILAAAWLERGPRDGDRQLLRRLTFAALAETDLAELAQTAAFGARSIDDVDIARALSSTIIRDLDRDAPASLMVPSGRTHALEYHDDGTVSASVKLQELFGLAETPRIGKRRTPVRLALLAPNGRPVQITQDLRSFWENTYPEVRRELRGRYPKHPWPEDPWTAPPTARTIRRRN